MKTKKIIVGILILLAILVYANTVNAMTFKLKREKSDILVGENLEIKAVIADYIYAGLIQETEKDVTEQCTWTSSNEDVATINNLGIVTGISQGSTTITAKYTETENGTYTITITCTITVTDPEKAEIAFSDEKLYSAMVEILGEKIAETDDENYIIKMTQANIDSVTSLDLHRKGIMDLDGLDRFTNLTELNLSDNEIYEIDKISNLTKLEKIDLSKNNIVRKEELGNLTNLANLEELDLSLQWYSRKDAQGLYQLSDLSEFPNLTNLKKLNLSFNRISDINPISNLTNLEELSLGGNKITDISAIANLTKLKNLDLSAQFDNLNQIALMVLLRGLNNGNAFAMINTGEDTIDYTDLTILEDISAINELTNLENIDLKYNRIVDISALEGKTYNIEVSHQYIKAVITENSVGLLPLLISAMKPQSMAYTEEEFTKENCSIVTFVIYQGEEISDVQGNIYLNEGANTASITINGGKLAGSKIVIERKTPEQLVEIKFNDQNLYNAMVEILGEKVAEKDDENHIIKMTQENIDSITSLDLSRKLIIDITGLESFTNLNELDLSLNGITNIDALENLTKLTSLNLNENKITDISKLSKLINLKVLELKGYRILAEGRMGILYNRY